MKGGGNKYLWYGVAVLAVIILIAALRGGAPNLGLEGTPTPSASVSASPTPTPAVRVTTSPIPSGLTYEQAIAQYEGRRFQFDQYCQANPRTMSVKNGTSVMLDNRSGDARTFAVGGVFYSIAGYGWRIVTPTSKTLPATLYLDCGSARNVGTLLLQP